LGNSDSHIREVITEEEMQNLIVIVKTSRTPGKRKKEIIPENVTEGHYQFSELEYSHLLPGKSQNYSTTGCVDPVVVNSKFRAWIEAQFVEEPQWESFPSISENNSEELVLLEILEEITPRSILIPIIPEIITPNGMVDKTVKSEKSSHALRKSERKSTQTRASKLKSEFAEKSSKLILASAEISSKFSGKSKSLSDMSEVLPLPLRFKTVNKQKKRLEKQLKVQKEREKKVKEKEHTKLIQHLNFLLEKGKKFKDPPPLVELHFVPAPPLLPNI